MLSSETLIGMADSTLHTPTWNWKATSMVTFVDVYVPRRLAIHYNGLQ